MVRTTIKNCNACNHLLSVANSSIGPQSCPRCEKNGITNKLCGKCFMETNFDKCSCISTLDRLVSSNLINQTSNEIISVKPIEEDYTFATKNTAHNSKGSKRKIGKGKRCSETDDQNLTCKDKSKTSISSVPAPDLLVLPSSNILNGTKLFFQNQQIPNKKNKNDSSMIQENNFAISMENYNKFTQYTKTIETDLYSSCLNYESKFSTWAFNLLANYNLCLYGIGCKRMIVNSFVKQYLYGEDVIEFEGDLRIEYMESSNKSPSGLKVLLNHILKCILLKPKDYELGVNLTTQTQSIVDLLDLHYERRKPELMTLESNDSVTDQNTNIANELEADDSEHIASSSLENINKKRPMRMTTQNSYRWGGRYAIAQSKLYIIIHDILGDNLNNTISQQCLSILASCESVALFVTLENLNSIVQWNKVILSRFRWIYEHVPTFQHHSIPDNFPLLYDKTMKNDNLLNKEAYNHKIIGVKAVLSSLTKHHNEMFTVLWDEILKYRINNPNHEKIFGIPFKHLLTVLGGKLIIKNDNDLNNLLKEFIDHKLFTISSYQNTPYVCTLLPKNVMDYFMSNVKAQ